MSRSYEEVLSKTAVIIPAYNAAAHLADVIDDTARIIPVERIIVIDDGSSDNTHAIAQHKAVVLEQHKPNRGKGAALRTGFAKAIQMGMGYVITLDADGQHDPTEIPKFIEHTAKTGADVIVGNRMSDRGEMPFIRVFANSATSVFVSLRSGTRIPDSQNGYRLFKMEVLEGIKLETTRYDTESEILIKAARKGARVDSVPVKTIYGEETSSVHPFVDTMRFLRMVGRSMFW
ncbi:MAG: glycosyltransferase family 2 protein [bacterium]|nr:glycosyltransferase family 2 protein [bacterium]